MGSSRVFIANKRNDLPLRSLLFRQSQQVQYFKNRKKIVMILTQCLKLKKQKLLGAKRKETKKNKTTNDVHKSFHR